MSVHWNLIAKLAASTGTQFTVPIYPLAPWAPPPPSSRRSPTWSPSWSPRSAPRTSRSWATPRAARSPWRSPCGCATVACLPRTGPS
ncbi:MAG: hypothetical protein WCP98_07050 [Actinomycetes bacterium]